MIEGNRVRALDSDISAYLQRPLRTLEKAEPTEILRTIPREGVTYLYLIPTLFNAVLELPQFDRTDLTSLRALGSGTQVMTETQVRTIVLA